ncbi:MAG TPA: OsmC family protein [Saprospiraceae bacterium]|nr:OsmC family protein [Saprospiraceae bacterium]
MKRTSSAHWEGSGKEGKGTISTTSGVLKEVSYTWSTRFEKAIGTSPEELIAAAHAACFSMKLSFVLNAAGFTPASIDTQCTVTIESGSITTSALEVVANVPGMDADAFAKCAEEAKLNCPVSQALKPEITLIAKLV